jgi:putative nucleotidyltransferase with HDIG domain
MITSAEETLRARVKNLNAIPTIPSLMKPLLTALDSPADQIDLLKIAELISQDESIAAQCLRVANSALFASRGPTYSIRNAVTSLGATKIRDILWTSWLARLAPKSKWPLNPAAFWEHSFGTALVSQQLAKKIGMPEPEHAYLCGLLHDIGEVLNTTLLPDEFGGVADLAVQNNWALLDAERDVLGFTHCDTGKLLAENWRLPGEIREVIEFHHSPELATSAGPLPALVNLADWLCRLRGMGYGYEEICEVDFQEAPAWGVLRKHVPHLEDLDVARFTLELDAEAEEIRTFVASTFRV